jgi:dienelactone hydrolase
MNTIRNDALREYAERLCTAGFTVYVPKSPGWRGWSCA